MSRAATARRSSSLVSLSSHSFLSRKASRSTSFRYCLCDRFDANSVSRGSPFPKDEKKDVVRGVVRAKKHATTDDDDDDDGNDDSERASSLLVLFLVVLGVLTRRSRVVVLMIWMMMMMMMMMMMLFVRRETKTVGR